MIKKWMIILGMILLILIILLIILHFTTSKKCKNGLQYSDSCKKCIKICEPKQIDTCLIDNCPEYPDSKNSVFDKKTEKNIKIKKGGYIFIPNPANPENESFLKLREEDLIRFFGGTTYNKYCRDSTMDDNCSKWNFNNTSLQDNPADAKGPFNNFFCSSSDYGTGLANFKIPKKVKGNNNVTFYCDSDKVIKGQTTFVPLPVTGDGKLYSDNTVDWDKLNNVNEKYELKDISDLNSSDFTEIPNLVVSQIIFKKDFEDLSVSPRSVGGCCNTVVQGGENFKLDWYSAGIITGNTGHRLYGDTTGIFGELCSSWVGPSLLNLPVCEMQGAKKYSYTVENNNKTVDQTDPTGELKEALSKGSEIAYTNNYICIGDTCVSSHLFWMVIVGIIKQSEDSKLVLNPSTKQIALSFMDQTAGPTKDKHVTGKLWKKAVYIFNSSSSPPKAEEALCKPMNTFHYTPENAPAKTNDRVYGPNRFPITRC